MGYTTIGIAISAVLFFTIHSFARPQPRTMTKEWQEATNEYLKVRYKKTAANKQSFRLFALRRIVADILFHRKKESTPSMALVAKDTRAKDTCRASLQRHGVSISMQKSRGWCILLLSRSRLLFFCNTRPVSRQGALSIGH